MSENEYEVIPPHQRANRAARRAQERRKPLSEAEQASAGQELGKGLQNLFKSKDQPHQPILKALERLGIEVMIKVVMIGEEPIDCLVIPTQELLVKEYAVLSGVDPNILLNGVQE